MKTLTYSLLITFLLTGITLAQGSATKPAGSATQAPAAQQGSTTQAPAAQQGSATKPAGSATQEGSATKPAGSETRDAAAAEGPALWTGPEDSAEVTAPGAVDANAARAFQTTESGLKYRILRPGNADAKPTGRSNVTVHYKGWLDNHTIFDSSYRRGEKISFPLNRVVAGWTEGLQLVGRGGMIELEIPAALGYGTQVKASIPANSTLHFVVELFDVK